MNTKDPPVSNAIRSSAKPRPLKNLTKSYVSSALKKLTKKKIKIYNLSIPNRVMEAYTHVIAGSQSSRKKSNSKIKTINGNISNNTLRILSWNKNNDPIANKMEDIKQLIIKHKPLIVVINELNLANNDHSCITEIKGFNFEKDDLINTNEIAYTGMWISEKLV